MTLQDKYAADAECQEFPYTKSSPASFRADGRRSSRKAAFQRADVLQHYDAKAVVQVIKEISEIGWKPLRTLNKVSASIGSR